ncbi:putative integrin beta-like protein [Trichinella patagoniensis]|uniref:Putative integrin beta-like protein n=2 Tax=Trichinella patagoniensis TaxID=990121 RepID=A0A0V0ZDH9_9BILA|nr:putative integrin beta-like protein [Trichinella patagoniensis]
MPRFVHFHSTSCFKLGRRPVSVEAAALARLRRAVAQSDAHALADRLDLCKHMLVYWLRSAFGLRLLAIHQRTRAFVSSQFSTVLCIVVDFLYSIRLFLFTDAISGITMAPPTRCKPFFSLLASYFIFFVCVFFATTTTTDAKRSPAQLCKTTSAQISCGQCIKQHPDCAWCADPNYDSVSRCEQFESLIQKCRREYVEHPTNQIDFPQNAEIGSTRRDPHSGANMRTQLQPQQVSLAIKPGETVSFSLRYWHQDRDTRDIYVLNSETDSLGVSIEYEAECRGIVQPGNHCSSVSQSDTVMFNVSVRLKECRSSGGSVISVGIGGVREVVALYINPICSCDCERLNSQVHISPQCENRGSLVCGACVCLPGSAGSRCECNVASGTVSAIELLNQCRQSPSDPPCSGRGQCHCGSCTCDSPEIYSGKYCQCDDTSCPSSGTELCSGHGRCECGICKCESGWSGSACDCPTDDMHCIAKNGLVCAGHGSCECGECVCRDKYSGPTCEHCADCEDEFSDHDDDDYLRMLTDHNNGDGNGNQVDGSVISEPIAKDAPAAAASSLSANAALLVLHVLLFSLVNRRLTLLPTAASWLGSIF